MLKAQNRLKDFEQLYISGRKTKVGCLLFITLPNTLEYSRVGIVVSKKISKKAVRRNYLKRIIRNFTVLPEQSLDIAVIVMFDPEKNAASAIKDSLNKWQKSL